MYHAIDMGVSVEAFWDMSARAVVLLHQEMRRSANAARTAASSPRQSAATQLPRLNYIPRP